MLALCHYGDHCLRRNLSFSLKLTRWHASAHLSAAQVCVCVRACVRVRAWVRDRGRERIGNKLCMQFVLFWTPVCVYWWVLSSGEKCWRIGKRDSLMSYLRIDCSHITGADTDRTKSRGVCVFACVCVVVSWVIVRWLWNGWASSHHRCHNILYLYTAGSFQFCFKVSSLLFS